MTNPRDDALRETSAAAAKYGVSEERIAELATRFAGEGPAGRMVFAAGWMHASLVKLAEVHREECDRVPCRTCDRIGDSLAMALAVLRAQMDDEFRGMYARPARRKWWRRGD